jgi:hypothetical protein
MAGSTIFKGKLFMYSLLFWMLVVIAPAYGQNTESVWLLDNKGNQTIYFDGNVRAIIIKAVESAFENLVVELADTSLPPTIDEHYWPDDGLYHSNPIVFDQPQQMAVIKGLELDQTVEVILIRWQEEIEHLKTLKLRTDCAKPEMISQAEWRAGLPDPDYERIHNTVRNVILHHSATSNSLTNYTSIVRSIYTYHTQVNEWSDIGYNYLIAPDGQIFAGRDPGDLIYDDEVLGAHFCSSNTGTLGICLLGTFTHQEPTEAALTSLNKLLAWKTAKDSLSPFRENPHPLNQNLGVIAAHRHGCATLCPGDAFLNILPTIKHNTNNLLENCDIFLSIAERQSGRKLQISPNPVGTNTFKIILPDEAIVGLRITDINSREVAYRADFLGNGVLQINAEMAAGIYFVVAFTKSAVYNAKLIRVN